MSKKGDIIERFMKEKGVTEETCEEHFNFKCPEYIENKKHTFGRHHHHHIKNLK